MRVDERRGREVVHAGLEETCGRRWWSQVRINARAQVVEGVKGTRRRAGMC